MNKSLIVGGLLGFQLTCLYIGVHYDSGILLLLCAGTMSGVEFAWLLKCLIEEGRKDVAD